MSSTTPDAPVPATAAAVTDQTSAPAVDPSGPLAAEIQHAIDQRHRFGLQADLAWVLAVAVDPRAKMELLDFPMLPEEVEAFVVQQADYDAVIGAVNRYAETVLDEFGGVYVDNEDRVVVALWTARPEVHRIKVLEQLGRFGPLRVRQVHYAKRDLRALQDRIAADWDWIEALQARPQGVGVDIAGNIVDMEISSTNPAAAAAIAGHYGVPADMLRVTSDGTGVALMPTGTVRGTVITAEGNAPGPNGLMLDWHGDGPGDCGGGDIGYGVNVDGSFDLPCTRGGWTIIVQAGGAEAGWVEVGRAYVVVPPNGSVDLRIVLEPGAKLGG